MHTYTFSDSSQDLRLRQHCFVFIWEGLSTLHFSLFLSYEYKIVEAESKKTLKKNLFHPSLLHLTSLWRFLWQLIELFYLVKGGPSVKECLQPYISKHGFLWFFKTFTVDQHFLFLSEMYSNSTSVCDFINPSCLPNPSTLQYHPNSKWTFPHLSLVDPLLFFF